MVIFAVFVMGGLFGFVFGMFLGAETVIHRELRPQLVREPDRILKTVFTPSNYNPGAGWVYHPELKEWHRGA